MRNTSAFARFPPRLQEAIASRLGWSSLRPVQEMAGHVLLDGKNAVILAPTAGGKTEASFFPLLATLMEREPQGVGLIYLAPLKALLNNQAERLGLYTEMVGLRRFLWHGDIKDSEKRAFIKEPTAVLMTTPESLEVMLLCLPRGKDSGGRAIPPRYKYQFIAGGLLSMGEQAERVFGSKNFMELYAVFSSPLLYKVQTQVGYIVGSLEQAFVDKLVPEMSSFLLGGRAWTVIHINHEERTVRVVLAPRGKKPSWGGFLPQLLGFEICQQIADILQTQSSIPYIDVSAQAALDECRADLRPLLQGGHSIQTEPDQALWWTFAGGQINHTLKYGLQFHHDWKIVADNFRLKIEGDSVSPTTLSLAIAQMSDNAFWNQLSTKRLIFGQLPEYRLSKFQKALPESYSLEMISDYLLDIPGAVLFLQMQEK